MRGTYITWLWLDIFLVLLNGDVLVGVVAFDSVCVAGVAMREEWAGLLLQFWW